MKERRKGKRLQKENSGREEEVGVAKLRAEANGEVVAAAR